jgi:uncharacterized protein YndB with AHSA1/START domain
MSDPIRVSVVVPLPLVSAFDRFAREMRDWWPRNYTWSQDVLQDIGLEPRNGGLCFEIGPHGFRCDWGRVLEWDPPRTLRLSWQIGPHREPTPDPRHGSVVALTFTADDMQHTAVTLVHDAFEHHGPDAPQYRAAMASSQGWPFILQRFVEAAS